MNDVLKNEVVRIEGEAEDLGLSILWSDAVQDNLAILSNSTAGKVVALFAIKSETSLETTYTFKAFDLNVSKWRWASDEGFTAQQMYDELGDMIFKPIQFRSILEHLS